MLGRLARYALRKATRVRLVSRMFEAPLTAAGVPASSLVYIPYRVDDRLFSTSPEKRRLGRTRLGASGELIVLSIGRFVPQKGYAELIRTFREIRRQRPDCRLVLVGGGPLEADYRRVAAEVGEPVTLIDWLDQAPLVELMAAADIYVQPSLSDLGEAMPRTVLEAMSCRLPVVATRVGGIPEVVHDEVGILVDPGEPGPLAEAVLQLAADPDLRERLGAAGAAEAAATYGWRTGFDRYRACLIDLARDAA